MTSTSLPWWRTDNYDDDTPVPEVFDRLAGPEGLALVKVWPDGRTTADWGLIPGKKKDGSLGKGFVKAYADGDFNSRRVLYGYEHGRWAFAFIMRSVPMICIDIDPKNGGLEHAKRLGVLPVTLAETSRSGDGFHLFYLLPETWTTEGFNSLSDRIGFEQGVDIRAVGCVYHWPTQRWNRQDPVMLPAHLQELLHRRDQKVAASKDRIAKVLESNDETEILIMHDELKERLAKPIPEGKRNQTLFAIGTQMFEAEVPDWEEAILDRAHQIGLDADEGHKIVANIQRYAQTA